MEIFDKKDFNSASESQSLAQQGLGLYYPNDLLGSLEKIGQLNNLSWTLDDHAAATPAEVAAYFLGQEIACRAWKNQPCPSPALPFSQVDRLHIPTSPQPKNILLLGCAGVESYTLEQSMLRKVGIVPKTHWTVDFSSFPLRRIAMKVRGIATFDSLPEYVQQRLLYGIDFHPSVLLQTDAAFLPLPDKSIDFVFADLFFGSQNRQGEGQILKEVGRILNNNGQLILKASILSPIPIYREILRQEMNSVGIKWRREMAMLYGDDKFTGRDNYLGLTPQQWLELGEHYSRFVLTYYLGSNRFTSLGQIYEFMKAGGFAVQEDTSHLPAEFDYVAIRAKKFRL